MKQKIQQLCENNRCDLDVTATYHFILSKIATSLKDYISKIITYTSCFL